MTFPSRLLIYLYSVICLQIPAILFYGPFFVFPTPVPYCLSSFNLCSPTQKAIEKTHTHYKHNILSITRYQYSEHKYQHFCFLLLLFWVFKTAKLPGSRTVFAFYFCIAQPNKNQKLWGLMTLMLIRNYLIC